jgi:hypothetical protein
MTAHRLLGTQPLGPVKMTSRDGQPVATDVTANSLALWLRDEAAVRSVPVVVDHDPLRPVGWLESARAHAGVLSLVAVTDGSRYAGAVASMIRSRAMYGLSLGLLADPATGQLGVQEVSVVGEAAARQARWSVTGEAKRAASGPPDVLDLLFAKRGAVWYSRA